MDVAVQNVVPHGAAPKQLMFGAMDGGYPSPKKGPPPRVTVAQPTESPDMPQATLVKEVHRLFEQGKVDAQHFQEISDVFANHCSWINGLRMLILDLQQKVTAVTVQAIDNDTGLKKSIAMQDAELKDNLRKFEEIVTKQGKDLKEVRDEATSTVQISDAKYGQAVATLEDAVQGLRAEVPARLTEMQAVVANMGENVVGRLNAVETEVTLQAGAAAATAPPGIGAGTMAPGEHRPLAFPQCATAPLPLQHGQSTTTSSSAPACATAPHPSLFGSSVPMGATAPPFAQPGQNGAAPNFAAGGGTMPQHHYVGDRDSHRSLFDDRSRAWRTPCTRCLLRPILRCQWIKS